MIKKDRHKIIQKAILSDQIESQDMLLKILLSKGVDITQATLSRDIKELQIVKVPTVSGSYSYQLTRDVQSDSSLMNSLTSYGFVSIEFSGNLAVVKTRPGYAMGIAGEIDEKITREIIGTVAGDDTILLIIKENISRKEVLQALSNFSNIINGVG